MAELTIFEMQGGQAGEIKVQVPESEPAIRKAIFDAGFFDGGQVYLPDDHIFVTMAGGVRICSNREILSYEPIKNGQHLNVTNLKWEG